MKARVAFAYLTLIMIIGVFMGGGFLIGSCVEILWNGGTAAVSRAWRENMVADPDAFMPAGFFIAIVFTAFSEFFWAWLMRKTGLIDEHTLARIIRRHS